MRTEKRCPHCRETLPLSAFLRPRSGAPSDYCGPCRKAKRRAEYERRGGSESAHMQLLRRYGITPEQYAAQNARQDSKCAVCEGAGATRLCVDLDSRGRLRGLICQRCVPLVGTVSETPRLLGRLDDYLDVGYRSEHYGQGYSDGYEYAQP